MINFKNSDFCKFWPSCLNSSKSREHFYGRFHRPLALLIHHWTLLSSAVQVRSLSVHFCVILPFTHCGGWPLCLKSIVLVLVRRKNGKNSWQCSGWVCESVFKRETPLFLSNVEQIHCPLLPNRWQIAKNQLFFHAFERVFYYPYKVYIYSTYTQQDILVEIIRHAL